MLEQIREYNVGDFRGNYPDVPIAAGVDLGALKETDAAPFFVTLPVVPEMGAISTNGLLYDEALVNSIEKQINQNRPGGIFGHLKDADRETSFPLPSGMWVGAKREGNTLWAKAYVAPGVGREYLRQLKAVGGRIATSIYGKGNYEKVRDGVRRLTDFALESLDFAPPERAALRGGGTPMITAEFESQENPSMDKAQLIAELTAKDIPAALREAIISEATAQNSQVAELTTQLADQNTLITELQTGIAAYQVREFESALDTRIAELTNWAVKGEAAQAKLDAFRRTLRSRVVSELGAERTTARISEVVTAIWADLQPLAETVRDALAGPAAIVHGKVRSGEKWRDDLAERAGEMRKEKGI